MYLLIDPSARIISFSRGRAGCVRLPKASSPAENPDATMHLTIEVDREDDGRWIAEVPDLPGVMAYGESRDQAIAHAEALALRVLADRLEQAEAGPDLISVSFRAA
jgi:predicted RNase H-like HicB family nuclease